MAAVESYGRSSDDWGALTTAGLRFLIEQAEMQRTTTYSELNAVLERRTGLRLFDFDLDSERAAMGHLLGLVVSRDRPASGHMISAIVLYLNDNDAGPGFYKLAQQYGMLSPSASSDEKLAFWTGEVAGVHQHYRRGRA